MGDPSNSKPESLTRDKEVQAATEWWLSEKVQEELLKRYRESKRPQSGGCLMPLTYAEYSGNPLMPVTNNAAQKVDEWEEVELTADSGACDNVMPLDM